MDKAETKYKALASTKEITQPKANNSPITILEAEVRELKEAIALSGG